MSILRREDLERIYENLKSEPFLYLSGEEYDEIENGCFDGVLLTALFFQSNIYKIGKNCFVGLKKIKSLYLNATVIHEDCFNNLNTLEYVNITCNGVLKKELFKNLNLSRIHILTTSEIPKDLFVLCKKVKRIEIEIQNNHNLNILHIPPELSSLKIYSPTEERLYPLALRCYYKNIFFTQIVKDGFDWFEIKKNVEYDKIGKLKKDKYLQKRNKYIRLHLNVMLKKRDFYLM
jgi:hypothetical protein